MGYTTVNGCLSYFPLSFLVERKWSKEHRSREISQGDARRLWRQQRVKNLHTRCLAPTAERLGAHRRVGYCRQVGMIVFAFVAELELQF